MPSDSINRTLVLSVVAVDLVGYSRKSVAEQMSLKDGFNQVLLQAIRDISVADRIILDTGDGVAMGFLGDPEDALYVAMFMHDAINRDSTGSPSGGMDSNAIRIGVNLGPVKLATGAGGHPNIIGDGINVAERIMSFAEPGQLTASRPFYEVMSRMSDHYATLFRYSGVHTDKQVRAHDVYVVGKSAAAFRQAQHGVAERASTRAGHPVAGQYVFPPASSAPPVRVAQAARDTKHTPRTGIADKPAKIDKPAPPAKAREPIPPIVTTPAAVSTGDAHPTSYALIDFLEDRNKVATTATLLAVIAVTLVALLVYRKMKAPVPTDNATPVVASSVPADTRPATNVVPSVPAPTPALTAGLAPSAIAPATVPAVPVQSPPASKVAAENQPTAPKGDAKSTPLPASSTATIPAVAPAATKPPLPPATTSAPVSAPTKTVERMPAPVTASDALRDKPKDARIEKADQADKAGKGERTDRPGKADKSGSRDDARKSFAPRGERVAPGTAVPAIPAYQTPVEAPRPEIVAPIPAPPPVVADTSINVLSRSAPAYPIEATRQSITAGFVRAKLTIDANGNVSEVEILESRPISAFGRETRQSAKQWKYNRGAAGRVQEIEITFKP